MKESYRVQVESKRLVYDFELTKKITIIQGDSGTGKTTLINLINNYNTGSSPVKLKCDIPCKVINNIDNDWQHKIEGYKNCILFIDKNNKFITSKEFIDIISKSDNYFVIISRKLQSLLSPEDYIIYEPLTTKRENKQIHITFKKKDKAYA